MVRIALRLQPIQLDRSRLLGFDQTVRGAGSTSFGGKVGTKPDAAIGGPGACRIGGKVGTKPGI